MKDIICVIAGGEWQAPIIQKLQDNNYDVLCLNLYSETKGAQLSDYFEKVNVIDQISCLKAASKYNLKGVLTDQSDISVQSVAYVAEKLGLPGIGLKCAELFTNKLLMRKKALHLGIHCPEFGAAIDHEHAEELARKIGLPIILKPIDGQSSRGVVLVKDWESLASAIREAFSFTHDNNPILVEEYIEGQEWTVEGFKQNGVHISLAVSYKEHFNSNPTVASSLNYIPLNASPLHQALTSQNDRLVNGMGMNFGITHAEYKLFNDKFYLIEIASRGGGTKISSHVIPLMSSVDVNQMLIDNVSGQIVEDCISEVTGNFVLLTFLNFQHGKVKSRTDESFVKELPLVIDFKYNFEVGDVIKKVADDRSRHAHLLLCAKSQSELDEQLIQVKRIVDIFYE